MFDIYVCVSGCINKYGIMNLRLLLFHIKGIVGMKESGRENTLIIARSVSLIATAFVIFALHHPVFTDSYQMLFSNILEISYNV